MTRQQFIDKYHLAPPQEQAGMIHDFILEAVGNPGKIEPEKPRFYWEEEDLCSRLRDETEADDYHVCLWHSFPGDIEEAKAQLLRIAEVGK